MFVRSLFLDGPRKKASRNLVHMHPFTDFKPRTDFEFDPALKWFPHHMAKAKVAIPKKMPMVDVVVEVRDARLPVTSAQFELDEMIKLRPGKHRIVILNKQDLVPRLVCREAVSLLEMEGTPVFATSAVNHSNISEINAFITKHVSARFKSLGITVMIVGLPNTGKSTILNAMKSVSPSPSFEKAEAKTSAVPGSTTHVGRIQINSHSPKIFVLDTPGIMVTKSGLNPISSSEMMMKLHLIGCMPDTLVGINVLCDYILFMLNREGNFEYCKKLCLPAPTNELDIVITAVAQQIREIANNRTTGRLDHHGAAMKFIKMFRDGTLGKICLDEIPNVDQIYIDREREKKFIFLTEPPGPWGPSTYPIDTTLNRAIYIPKHISPK